jgi:hypothetical protein
LLVLRDNFKSILGTNVCVIYKATHLSYEKDGVE